MQTINGIWDARQHDIRIAPRRKGHCQLASCKIVSGVRHEENHAFIRLCAAIPDIGGVLHTPAC